MPKANIRAPTNYQEAAELLAEARRSRTDKWTKARVFREAIEEYLANAEDLPGEARDLLDDDLLANAGGDDAIAENGVDPSTTEEATRR